MNPAATADAIGELVSFGVPGGALIAGHWQTDRLTLSVHDPEDGRCVARAAHNLADEVATAVRAAVAATTVEWPLWQRREVLDRAARLVAEHKPRLAGIIATEGSKTINEAEHEVARCAETLRLCAAAGPLLRGEVLEFADTPRGGGRRGWFVRRPVGVVAAITPFNDPLNLVAHKVGPGLLAGNAVVLKPAETTPISALALADLLVRAGVPDGRLSVVCGLADTGAALVGHPDVDLISFTGGSATAELIAQRAGPRKLLMELGGNNATIVRPDADIATAATQIVRGAFGCAGQNCLSVQRVYAHSSVFADLLDRVVTGAERLRVGAKTDRATDVGPMISEEAAVRVQAMVERAVAAGARVRTGGGRSGAFYRPTVLTDVPPDAEIMRTEVFGPVVCLAPYHHDDEAIAAANATDHALQAGIFTSDVATALGLTDRLLVGAVVVNGTSDVRIDSMPFGGFGRSGIGREGVRFAVEAMSEPKCTILEPGTTKAPV